LSQAVATASSPPRAVPKRSVGDAVFASLARASGILVLVLLGAIIVTLFLGGLPAFQQFGASFLANADWDPVQDVYGGAVPIYGTVVTSIIALVLAVPLAFGIAFFLTELAPQWVRRPVGTAVELLAAVPSIIYGMWGFFVIVPVMAEYVQPWAIDTLGELPVVGWLFGGPAYGTGLRIQVISPRH
jgi:phosphate transport system permease protein